MDRFAPLTPAQLANALARKSVSDRHPWVTNCHQATDDYYSQLCDRVTGITGASCRVSRAEECGYASFIEAFFYRPAFEYTGPNGRKDVSPGLTVLLSRLGPYFVFMRGARSRHPAEHTQEMPAFDSVDQLGPGFVNGLAKAVQPVLEAEGLVRLSREALAATLDPSLRLPASFDAAPARAFDALFYLST
jgi:hypothetical protein